MLLPSVYVSEIKSINFNNFFFVGNPFAYCLKRGKNLLLFITGFDLSF